MLSHAGHVITIILINISRRLCIVLVDLLFAQHPDLVSPLAVLYNVVMQGRGHAQSAILLLSRCCLHLLRLLKAGIPTYKNKLALEGIDRSTLFQMSNPPYKRYEYLFNAIQSSHT